MRGTKMAAVAALVLFGSTLPAMGAVRDLNTIKKGDTVPSFTGRTIDGGEVDSTAHLGKKVVVLAFWSIYCKPCVDEISSLIRLQETFGGEVQVIGINSDSELGVGRIRTFMDRFEEYEKKKINYPNIYDEGNRISKLLGVGFLPSVISVGARGTVEEIFVGFEEQSEQEIFDGITAILPEEKRPVPEDEDLRTFSAEAVVPLCGFYGPAGWLKSFDGVTDLEQEKERARQAAGRLATKLVMRGALRSLGVTLAEEPAGDGCFRSYGVYIQDDPFQVRDCLTNLLRELNTDRLVQVIEEQGDFLGSEYRVTIKASVNVDDLKDDLEDLRYQLTPRTVTFAVVNVKKLDLVKFERLLMRQSRYIGYFSFPTATIYTTTDEFADEIKKMDLEGLRHFVEDAGSDRIELEVWR